MLMGWLLGFCSEYRRLVGVSHLSQLREKATSQAHRELETQPLHLYVATNANIADACAKLIWQDASIVMQNVNEGQETDVL